MMHSLAGAAVLPKAAYGQAIMLRKASRETSAGRANSNFRQSSIFGKAHRLRLVLDIGVGTVAAGRGLGMPLAVGSLVFDRLGAAGHALFGRGAPGGRKRRGVSGESFREYAADGVGPAAVVLDDLVGDVAHRELAFVDAGKATRVNASLILYKIGGNVGFCLGRSSAGISARVPASVPKGEAKCAATSRRCSISSRPRPRTKFTPRRCNSCENSPVSTSRRRPMPRRSIARSRKSRRRPGAY